MNYPKNRKRKLPSPLDHFNGNYRIVASGCWIWKKSINAGGYGQCSFKIEGLPKITRAHRLAYYLCVGKIPEGLDVCHKCDVRSCVNPDHLFLGTRKENMQDAVSKKRTLHGERNNRSKLTEKKVKEIKNLLLMRNGVKEIADKYRVDQSTIYRIKRGDNW